MSDGKQVLLSCKSICKNFGPTRALIDVDFELRRGEICGLIGENGSGKSTLTSVFAGAVKQTSGSLFINGKPYEPNNMVDAQKNGIAIIMQEAATLPSVDVASNIFVGNYELFSTLGVLDKKKMHFEANKIIKEIGVIGFDAATPLYKLGFEDRKIVEILRAMYLRPEVLIIDESTTALAQKGRQLIYGLIKQMKVENKGVIFISHDLEELEKTCNTITCLRDGVKVGKLEGNEITPDKMRQMMVGRELQGHYYRVDWNVDISDEVVLDVKHITSMDGYVKNFSMQLHKGEILGFGGLAGCGMHEVGRMIFGLDKYITGEVLHVKTGKKLKNVQDAVNKEIGYISKDRDNESIVLNASIQDNTVMASMKRLTKGFFVHKKDEKKVSDEQIDLMRTKCVSGDQYCSDLSGGNKQKVAFSKWLAAGSEIFIMDCPTRGIDIGVKAAMYQLLYKFKEEGKSVIMISEELPELIGMSDRMIIMQDGKISGELLRNEQITDTQIIEYMV